MQEYGVEEINLRRYWALVVKRRYIAVSAALIVISAFTWGSLLWPKTYEASSTVLFEPHTNIDPQAGTPQSYAGGVEERLTILSNALTSRSMVERVIRKIYQAPDVARHEWLINDLARNLDVTSKSPKGMASTGLFVVKYKGKDPVQITNVVNTLVTEYIDDNVNKKRSEASVDYEFLKGQALDSKKKLEESDRAIRAFMERNPDVVKPVEGSVTARVEVLESAKMDAQIKLSEAIRKRESLQKQLASAAKVNEVTDVKLSELNNQLAALQARYTDDYPDVQKVKNEIEELKRQPKKQPASEAIAVNPAYQQLKRQLADTETEIPSLRARYEGLTRQQAAAQGQLGHVPKAQEELESLQRERTANQKVYEDLTQKLEGANVSRKLELASMTAGFRVVDPAIIPDHPVKPNIVMLIVLGIVLGAVAGMVAAVGLDNLARSFKDEESIETKFNLPVLATIHTVTTEADRASARKVDARVFTAAGAYFLVVLLVLAKELLYR